MRKTTATLVAAGALLLGIATASPALAKTAPLSQLCSPGTNGGTVVNGVCVLPGAVVGLGYEGFIDTSDLAGGFRVGAGSTNCGGAGPVQGHGVPASSTVCQLPVDSWP
jgi:hypothetical protein